MTWEPADALRRIAFLLERSRAGTYRVKAFRGAAATAAATDPRSCAPGPDAGTLSDLPGIGSATEAVIREALAGETPAYLASLEEKAAAPLAEGGDTVRAALRGDLHCHSDWSDGGSPIEEMVLTAVELGHDYLVLTDHSPRLKVANGLSAERLTKQLGVVDADQRGAAGLPAAQGHRGRHPRRRRARPDAGDAGPARRRGGLGALQAADGRPRR